MYDKCVIVGVKGQLP